jgi:hypothetical protein
VAVQRGAPDVKGTIDGSRAGFVGQADATAASHVSRVTSRYGHWLSGIERLLAAVAQAFKAGRGGGAILQTEHRFLSRASGRRLAFLSVRPFPPQLCLTWRWNCSPHAAIHRLTGIRDDRRCVVMRPNRLAQ